MAVIRKYSEEFIKDLGGLIESLEEDLILKGKWNIAMRMLRDDLGYAKEIAEIKNKENLRSLYRFYYKDLKEKRRINEAKFEDKLAGNEDLESRILKRIVKKTSVKALADLLDVTPDDILLAATKMKLSGHTNIKIYREGPTEYIQLIKKFKRLDNEFDKTDTWNGEKEIVIGVVSDTHMGSEYHANEELHKVYDIFQSRGIKMVLHAGDLSEGMKKARMETFLGNKAIGFQAQLDYVVENYPKRKGITTYMISGNHDNWYMQEGLANFVNTVSLIRPDMKYMGDDFARIWITPKIDITLYHPNDGSSSNVFTKLQNFGDRGGNKLSKINIIGHYHKLGWIYYRDMHILYPASFQHQSEWMNINNLASIVGCLILKLKLKDDGSLKDLIIEYISNFD